MLVHGDDFFPSVKPADLDWLESELGKRYEIQMQRLGSGPENMARFKSSTAL